MDRRQLIRRGVALGALGAVGAGVRYGLLPPSPRSVLAPVDELAREFFASLDDEQRAQVCVPYDHPLRQYHNRGVAGGGLGIFGWGFSWGQRQLLTDLLHASLSEHGRDVVPEQFFLRWPGVQICRALVCGDPHEEDWQIVLSGPHLNQRIGGKSREGAAFGGPLVYGDQRGDEQAGLPGNLYRADLQSAQRIFEALEPHQRDRALLPEQPIQTRIEVQGARGTFPGIEVADLSKENRAAVGKLVADILRPYPETDVAYAQECIAANGGLEALSIAWYADGEVEGSGTYQVFRIEGPGTVLYFRGAPHLHAFINIAMDAENPLSVGEVVCQNDADVDDAGVKRIFEEAMKRAESCDLAYYPQGAVVGQLPRGTVREGDVYVMESWRDRIAVAEIRGADLEGETRREHEARGGTIDPARTYRVASTGEAASDGRAVGRKASWTGGAALRHATVDYLREHGL